jgi:hypothetical protein
MRPNMNPDPGPWRREPDTEEARAPLRSTGGAWEEGTLPLDPGTREGASGGSHRCGTVSSESEAP